MKASLNYGSQKDIAAKHNITQKNLVDLSYAYNIRGGKQRTSKNIKKGERIKLVTTMDKLHFLDYVDI
ncbi:hypothetical protein [Clostridium kluyveri]|uniref:Uncharacterized protein n=1 Tax=Clostridium kluyveri TaxID=1534 RepID=A0A1L5F4P1_CLOKL|nr:hypothetical protein [Clostridium kluyveri]APM37963.1 hypothetical protein BS101_04045 [Clostridium kluyveri]UZQ52033.1 hypothetical protein OP486_07695 [Clostridium kluyveri]